MRAFKDTKFTFKRFEKKYLLNPEQYARFMAAASGHLVPDEFHKSTVYSLYYDSSDFELIRRSIEAPVYKEKLRLRSYGSISENGGVFVELKKKFKGIVYKRRVETGPEQAEKWLAGGKAPFDSQICREIDWFLKKNSVSPKCMIICNRISWADRDKKDLRVTFDTSILWRDYDLSISSGGGGRELLKEGETLMELKIPGASPLWLANLLSDEKIFPTSYSKYGICYKTELINKADFTASETGEQ